MIQTNELAICEGKPFGNIMMNATYQELIELGFVPGDSVNVFFSNGIVLEDIPFLSGGVLPEGAICLNAYPGFDWIRIEKRFGYVWNACHMTGTETGRILLNKHGKYEILQDAFCMNFASSRELCSSDESFTNYRSLSGGKIQPGNVYRSVAAFDPIHNNGDFYIRQQYLDGLMERDGIQFVLNMTCGREQAEELFSSGKYEGFYIQRLYAEGKVFSAQFPLDYLGTEFRNMLSEALRVMIAHAGPYLIQCRAGLDRTGFLSCLLEALMGADRKEITDDYMRSYECLVGLIRDRNRKQYEFLSLCQTDRILELLTCGKSVPRSLSTILSCGERILEENELNPIYAAANLSVSAMNYLQECGMTPEEIGKLKRLLIKPLL